MAWTCPASITTSYAMKMILYGYMFYIYRHIDIHIITLYNTYNYRKHRIVRYLNASDFVFRSGTLIGKCIPLEGSAVLL